MKVSCMPSCIRPEVIFYFTSPQPVRPKEDSDSVSTIRDVMPLTVKAPSALLLNALNVSAARQALTVRLTPDQRILCSDCEKMYYA